MVSTFVVRAPLVGLVFRVAVLFVGGFFPFGVVVRVAVFIGGIVREAASDRQSGPRPSVPEFQMLAGRCCDQTAATGADATW